MTIEEIINQIDQQATIDNKYTNGYDRGFVELRKYSDKHRRYRWVAKVSPVTWGYGETPREALEDLYKKVMDKDVK
jgi:hypothetical protein